jgi:thiamine-monophosphate kinase
MISIGLPANCTRPYVEGLARGFAGASKEFEVKIVGGDTNEANGLVIDCSMIGFASKMPARNGARPGDSVVVSGMFGLPPAGLAILMRKAVAAGAFRKQAADSVLFPVPRLWRGTCETFFVVDRFKRRACDVALRAGEPEQSQHHG